MKGPNLLSSGELDRTGRFAWNSMRVLILHSNIIRIIWRFWQEARWRQFKYLDFGELSNSYQRLGGLLEQPVISIIHTWQPGNFLQLIFSTGMWILSNLFPIIETCSALLLFNILAMLQCRVADRAFHIKTITDVTLNEHPLLYPHMTPHPENSFEITFAHFTFSHYFNYNWIKHLLLFTTLKAVQPSKYCKMWK